MGKLTEKRDRFAREFIVDLNATQATIRAGYSEKGARQRGSKLLTNIDIQERIQELQRDFNKPIEQKYTISREIILDKLARHATVEIKLPEGDEMSRDYQLNLYNSISRNQIKAIEVINNMMGYDKPAPPKKQTISLGIEFTDAPELNQTEGFNDEDTE